MPHEQTQTDTSLESRRALLEDARSHLAVALMQSDTIKDEMTYEHVRDAFFQLEAALCQRT